MFEKRFNKKFLVLDGAMATNMFQMGLVSGDPPEWWNIEHPERVKKIHYSFTEAGSDIILTNTFGGNSLRLKLHQLESKAYELSRAGAFLARECMGSSGLVAGAMGPTGEILEPLGTLKQGEAIDVFCEQAEGLAEGGVDLLWIETLSDLNELKAALAGAMSTGLPIAATMSFDTSGKTMMGLSPSEFVEFMNEQPVVAYGANCGVGPEQLLNTIGEMKKAGGKKLIAKGNCGIPVFKDGKIRYTGTEAVMGNYAVKARNLGAELIGGCCGTTSHHIHIMSQELKNQPYEPISLNFQQALIKEPPQRKRHRRKGMRSSVKLHK